MKNFPSLESETVYVDCPEREDAVRALIMAGDKETMDKINRGKAEFQRVSLQETYRIRSV